MIKKGGIVWTIWNIVVAAIFMALGIVTIAKSGDTDFQNVIILIMGIIVIVDAGLRLLTQVLQFITVNGEKVLKTDLGAAIAGASELAVGILLICVSRNQAELGIILHYISLFAGILLITMGGVAIAYSVIFIVKKYYNLPVNIGLIVAGAAVVTAGVLILVYATNEAILQAFFVLFGLLFVLVGLGLLILTILYLVARRKQAKLEKAAAPEPADVMDAQVVEEPAEEKPAEEPEEKPVEEPEAKPEEEPEEKPEEPEKPEEEPSKEEKPE